MPYSLNIRINNVEQRCMSRLSARVRSLHHDEQGTISILSVITLLLLTMLLGMILNVGEQIDDKIQMQNAADAATYSGGAVIARGMNTIAFTNHLLSETFALTAYFQEGHDRYAERIVPAILNAWKQLIPEFELSNFALIRDIGPAMGPKLQLEKDLVQSFSEMTAVKAEILLPALTAILGAPERANFAMEPHQIAASHLIPTFQRAVSRVIPNAVTEVSCEIARRNSPPRTSGSTQCVIWSTQTVPVQAINQEDPLQRLLPAVDPSIEGPDYGLMSTSDTYIYHQMARLRRDKLAEDYLELWIGDDNYDMGPFERETRSKGGRVSGKMSQFVNLYRGFACAKLHALLQIDYPNTNLPHILRQPLDRLRQATSGPNQGPPTDDQLIRLGQQRYLDLDFTFDGAVYRSQRQPVMPGVYRRPIQGDAFAFARCSIYLPRPRFVTFPGYSNFHCPEYDGWLEKSYAITPCFDGWPQEWSLFSQNWAVKLIPTSAENTLALIQTNPRQFAPGVRLPDTSSIEIDDLKSINFH